MIISWKLETVSRARPRWLLPFFPRLIAFQPVINIKLQQISILRIIEEKWGGEVFFRTDFELITRFADIFRQISTTSTQFYVRRRNYLQRHCSSNPWCSIKILPLTGSPQCGASPKSDFVPWVLLAILLGRKIICLGRPPLKPETPPSLPFQCRKPLETQASRLFHLITMEKLLRKIWRGKVGRRHRLSFLFLLLPSPPPTEWPRNRSYGTNFTGNNYRRKPSPIQSFPSEQTTGFSVARPKASKRI